jgi:hypothetical protein
MQFDFGLGRVEQTDQHAARLYSHFVRAQDEELKVLGTAREVDVTAQAQVSGDKNAHKTRKPVEGTGKVEIEILDHVVSRGQCKAVTLVVDMQVPGSARTKWQRSGIRWEGNVGETSG